MRIQKLNILSSAAVLATILSVGCAKHVAKVQPPAAPSAPAPTATLAASPEVIQQGQRTTLTWQTSNASEITIAGIGTLAATGSRVVTPDSSMTYNLVAKGPGGATDASARVTVNPQTVARVTSPSDEDLFARNMKDIFFDYDKSTIRLNQAGPTEGNAAFLAQHPTMKVMIEGHCDDRGSEEYNLALGTSRAESLKQSLQQQGVPADRIATITYGKEKPFCTEESEQCWQQNRVDHLVLNK
jgi:peptidoglycan-associated lipoprotein